MIVYELFADSRLTLRTRSEHEAVRAYNVAYELYKGEHRKFLTHPFVEVEPPILRRTLIEETYDYEEEDWI